MCIQNDDWLGLFLEVVLTQFLQGRISTLGNVT